MKPQVTHVRQESSLSLYELVARIYVVAQSKLGQFLLNKYFSF